MLQLLVGKGKEKQIKQKAVKKSEVKGSAKGTKVDHGTKRRKTTSTCKQLVIYEGPEEANPSAIGKDISDPPIPKIRVKTKVESSILQILVGSLKGTSFVVVTFSTQGSSGSLDIIPRSPQGPSRCTHSRQKTTEEPIKRERREGLVPSSLILSF